MSKSEGSWARLIALSWRIAFVGYYIHVKCVRSQTGNGCEVLVEDDATQFEDVDAFVTAIGQYTWDASADRCRATVKVALAAAYGNNVKTRIDWRPGDKSIGIELPGAIWKAAVGKQFQYGCVCEKPVPEDGQDGSQPLPPPEPPPQIPPSDMLPPWPSEHEMRKIVPYPG